MRSQIKFNECQHWSSDGIQCSVCGEMVPENKRRNNMLFGSEDTLKIQKEDETEGKHLEIWLMGDKSMDFYAVKNLKRTHNELTFEYEDILRQEFRTATFKQVNIIGFSLEN